jgi:hypothetical protein
MPYAVAETASCTAARCATSSFVQAPCGRPSRGAASRRASRRRWRRRVGPQPPRPERTSSPAARPLRTPRGRGCQQPLVGRHVGRNQAGELPAVEVVGTVLGEPLQRVGEVRDADESPSCSGVPSGRWTRRGAVRVPAEDDLVREVEVVGRDPAEREPVTRRLVRRCHDLAPRRRAVRAVRAVQCRQRARRRDRAVAHVDDQAAAVRRPPWRRPAPKRSRPARGPASRRCRRP